MSSENSQNSQEKSWFAEVSWKTSLIYVGLSILAGGSTGAGLVATKSVSAQNLGITQDQADVRYLSRHDAETRSENRDKQIEDLKKQILTREVFEAYHKNDVERMERLEKLTERILENK